MKSAYLKSESKRELHYILPFEEIKKGNAERLFQALESSLDTLEISSFGVMDTTLEEVFLKVTEAFHCPEGKHFHLHYLNLLFDMLNCFVCSFSFTAFFVFFLKPI